MELLIEKVILIVDCGKCFISSFSFQFLHFSKKWFVQYKKCAVYPSVRLAVQQLLPVFPSHALFLK